MVRRLLKLGFVLAAGAAGWFVPAAALKDIAAEVVAAFSVLAAFLVQLMLLLATVLNPGRLRAEQITIIATRLREQQQRATLLFTTYVVAIALFLAVKLPLGLGYEAAWQAYTLHALSSAALAISAYCLLGTASFLASLRGLQTLRHELLVREAEAREQEERRQAAATVAYFGPPAGSSSFGRRHGT